MRLSLGLITLLVRSYDEALSFFISKLSFELVEDTLIPDQNKRWVVISPPGSGTNSCRLLLAQASTPEQEACIGKQTGGRVFLFLYTDDFGRDYRKLIDNGVKFTRDPKVEPYGTVAVFEDCEGNLWDLLELNS